MQVLTPTGARPEAFALCQRWARQQDYTGRVVWFIVDDGPNPQHVGPMPPNWQTVLIRRAPFWKPGQNTQAANILRGLDAVDVNQPLAIFEDDDYYAPGWLTHVAGLLGDADLVGETKSRYYNVRTRVGRELPNTKHASLCACAMVGPGINALRRAAQGREKFIDIDLWRRVRRQRLFTGHRVVGIKGLPGRGGIGVGHRQEFRGTADPGGRLLREWIGKDAEAYL